MENTQNMQSGRTWQGLFQAIKGRISAGCLKKSQRPTFQCLIAEDGQTPEWLEAGGEVQLGDCWTLNTGEYPSEENVSILCEILEREVPEKYFLSAKVCWAMLQRAEDMKRDMPDRLRIALLEVIAEEWHKAQTDK